MGACSGISGEDIRSLAVSLASAFNAEQIASLVYASTGDRLYDGYVPARALPLRPLIRELLDGLKKAGVTRLFLAAAYRETRKHRQDVAAEILRVCPGAGEPLILSDALVQIQVAGKAQAEGPERASAPGFERNIRPKLAQFDVHVWLSRLENIERQVCRVEVSGNASGTGFLVGPDAVLTNYHVIEAAKTTGSMANVACRFDYLKLVDGTRSEGIQIGLAPAACVSFRPYSPAERTKTPDDPQPTGDQLDYALLRIARPVGSDDPEGARGWVRLPDTEMPMKAGDPLIIVQHPDGAPMKLAIDTDAIISVNANRTRVRYATNTEAGSSGSPCFTLDWELVALHHFGDPAWAEPVYNQGVPAQPIRKRILDDGFGPLLEQ